MIVGEGVGIGRRADFWGVGSVKRGDAMLEKVVGKVKTGP